MVVDIAGDERFPPLGGSDLYLYLHVDGVVSTTSADGKVSQRPLPDVIEAVHRAQADGGTVWISGPDSPLGLAALDTLLATEPEPIQPWVASHPPVTWRNGANGFLAAARFGQDRILDDLCDRGVDLNWRDDDGNTALHCAAYGKNEYGVARLLRAGAEIDCRNTDGLTPEMISLAQGTDPITRRFLERSQDLRQPKQRFRSGHWLPRAAGVLMGGVVLATPVVLTVTGIIHWVAGLALFVLMAVVLVRAWRRRPPGPVASVFAIRGPHLTLIRGGFRRIRLDLGAIEQAAYVGQTSGPTDLYIGPGYLVVPSRLGKPWTRPPGNGTGQGVDEFAVIDSWPSALIIEYRRMWRDEVVLPLARQFVIAGTDMTPRLRQEVRDAVLQAAVAASDQRPGIAWPDRLRRLFLLRKIPGHPRQVIDGTRDSSR